MTLRLKTYICEIFGGKKQMTDKRKQIDRKNGLNNDRLWMEHNIYMATKYLTKTQNYKTSIELLYGK